jgi:hypothetical protein
MEAGEAALATPAEINASLARDNAPPQRSRADSITEIAGLLALVSGLVVLGLVAAVAMIVTPDGSKDVAVGAFGVIGSVVGAYFGLKVGAEGSKKAVEAQRQEAAKAQVFAAHIPPNDVERVFSLAHDAAKSVAKR